MDDNNSKMPSPVSEENQGEDSNVEQEVSDFPELEKSLIDNELEDDKPKIIDPSKNDSVIEVTKMRSSGIEVIANRKGFYNQRRLVTGDKFKVKNFEALGEWMNCVDPVIEKQRVKVLQEKKVRK